jgi:hypothetical protein
MAKRDMMLVLGGGAGGAGAAGGGELDDYDDDLEMMGGEEDGEDEELDPVYPPEFEVFAESALGSAEPDRIAALYQAVKACTEEY